MSMAIIAVNEKQMSSKDYEVPKTTLIRRVQRKNINATGSKKGFGRFLFTFPQAQ